MIYIRHAEKEESANLAQDPDITESGILDSERLALTLGSMYGRPDFIICSPYLRTRQTANAMANQFGLEPGLDILISEYQKQRLDSITVETSGYNPPQNENYKLFQSRIGQHLQMYQNSKLKIWFITHGSVIKCIRKTLNLSKNGSIQYLSYIQILH